jgi:hypothetical protein
MQSLAPTDVAPGLAILVGVGVIGATAWRWLGVVLREGGAGPAHHRTGERLFLAGGVFFCILFGTFPQLFAGIFEAARGFTNLIP